MLIYRPKAMKRKFHPFNIIVEIDGLSTIYINFIDNMHIYLFGDLVTMSRFNTNTN